VFSSFKISPIEIIKFAQLANGVLLPVIALFLLWVVNKTSVLGIYKNSVIQNIVSIAIILVTIVLGFKSILKVFEFF
jgi:manganese transport protein